MLEHPEPGRPADPHQLLHRRRAVDIARPQMGDLPAPPQAAGDLRRRGRLAGTGGPHHRQPFTWWQVQIDVLQHQADTGHTEGILHPPGQDLQQLRQILGGQEGEFAIVETPQHILIVGRFGFKLLQALS